VLAIFVESVFLPEGALRQALRMIDAARREEDESQGEMRLVRTARELDAALEAGALACILALEGVEPLGRDPELIGPLAHLGVRMAGLTWNRATPFADGLGEDSGRGITMLGEALLGELAGHGVALDLAHLSPRGTEGALETYTGPILCSHANARSVYDNPRNLTDDVLREIAARGGVAGLCMQRVFLGPGEVPEAVAAHHARMRSIDPRLPAFGADFTAFLPEAAAPDRPGIGLPAGSDRSLNDRPEAPRETVYAAALELIGPAQAEAVASANALRFLRSALA
jgi:membrane dipeptidase